MSSSLSYELFFEDSSSSDDSDLNELLNDDDTKHMIILATAKELQDIFNLNRRRGSMACRICIPRNRALWHAALMQDYFVEVPTYPPLFLEGTGCTVVCSSI
jgi:hypothetical protein